MKINERMLARYKVFNSFNVILYPAAGRSKKLQLVPETVSCLKTELALLENYFVMPEIDKKRMAKETTSKSSPSLLRQLVDAIDEMDEGAKKLLLLSLKKRELSEKYAMLDEEIAKSGEIMDEAAIATLAAVTRKEMYEQKIRS